MTRAFDPVSRFALCGVPDASNPAQVHQLVADLVADRPVAYIFDRPELPEQYDFALDMVESGLLRYCNTYRRPHPSYEWFAGSHPVPDVEYKGIETLAASDDEQFKIV